jgi:hypothetical protein
MRGLSVGAAVLMLLLAVPLQGQVGPRGMQDQWGMQGQGSMMGSQQMGMGSADGILWLREALSLTEEQVESLKDASEAARAIHDGARLQMRGMRDQLRDGNITQGQFMDLMTAHRDAMMQQQIGSQERIDAILTDEQRAQLQSRQGWGARGRGMRGGQGAGRGFNQGPGGRGGWGMGPGTGSGMRGFGPGFNGSGMRGVNRAYMHGRAFGRGFARGMIR